MRNTAADRLKEEGNCSDNKAASGRRAENHRHRVD
jgi:hypothetical protein